MANLVERPGRHRRGRWDVTTGKKASVEVRQHESASGRRHQPIKHAIVFQRGRWGVEWGLGWSGGEEGKIKNGRLSM